LYSKQYTGPLTITANTKLQVIGMETGFATSPVATAAITP
jgi:hypothetical protein